MAKKPIMSARATIQSASLTLTKDNETWIKRAWDAIDETSLAELNRLMASIPSPTGEEGQLARAMVDVMNKSGVDASYQPLDDDQGNAIGRIQGIGAGADLLLYAPLDTLSRPMRKKNVRGSAIECQLK